MKKSCLFLLPLVLLIFIAGCAEQGPAGDTGSTGGEGSVCMMFQDGVYPSNAYSGTRDNDLNWGSQNCNYGAATHIYAGCETFSLNLHRGIIKFDVSTIVPSSVVVKSAYLTLNVEDHNGTPTIEVHKIPESWTEGALNGVDGVSSWISREAGIKWTTSGGSPEAAIIDSKTVQSNGYVTFRISSSIVQSWIDNPLTNYGLLLKKKNDNPSGGGADNNNIYYSSRENVTDECHPKLTIYYNLP